MKKIKNKKKNITLLLIVAGLFLLAVLLIGGNELIKGAVTADIAPPVYNLKADNDLSLSAGKVLDVRGAYATENYKGIQNRALKFDGRDSYVVTSSNHLQT